MPPTIAIVEDDPDQRDNYAHALVRRGYTVQCYPDRRQAAQGIVQDPPDLAIVDIMLGDEPDGGFDLCRELLAREPGLPVVFLTSRADDIDRISGLRLGAWDYQTKPVSLAFLAERISSLFRIRDANRAPAGGGTTLAVGELQLDIECCQATWRGRPLQLTYTELRMLEELVRRRAGRGASYDQLAEATRQGVVQNNTINTHVQHIRAKFQALDPDFACINSVYGFGYRWVCQ